MFSADVATMRYQPTDERDCDHDEFLARVGLCESCQFRKLNRCPLVRQIIGIHARRRANHCPLGGWPGDPAPRPVPATLPPQIVRRDNETRPRVGFVYPVWQALGGVERHTLTLVKNAPEIQWSGLVALYPHLVNRDALAKLNRIMPATELEGLERLKANSDILIVWGFTEAVDKWLRGYRGKVIAITHGEGQFSENQLRQVLPFATRCVSVSEAAVTAFPEAYRPNVAVIRNGIELDRVAPSRDKAACREALGIAPSQFIVGSLGRLSEEKNPLAAAQAVAALGGNAFALYVGDNGDAATANRFIEQAKRIAPGRIIWQREVNHESIGDYYKAMDVFVMASEREGGPIVTVEAWLAGVPQVATPVGMIPELEREHGALTWQVPLNPTPNELANAIRSACADLSGDDDRVERARAVAIEELSAKRFGSNWTRLLQSM